MPEAVGRDAQGRGTMTLGARDLRVWHWRDATLTGTAQAGRAQAEPPLELRRAGAGDTPWLEVLDLIDPAGDDHGPEGRYVYPLDPAYAQHRPADIRRVQVATRHEGGGQALRITLTMAGLSSVWSPRNGFDHVAFTTFLELPRGGTESSTQTATPTAGNTAADTAAHPDPACTTTGSRVMPLQDGDLPGDLRWHRRLRAHGWSLALFGCEGASAQQEGRPLNRGVKVQTDPARQTVTFTLSAAALGHRPSLSGTRLWINTWDWDARYRALAPEAQNYTFGGGRAGQPRVMDSTDILVLP